MGDSVYDPPAGYALRKNGTCGADQETCGNPWNDWHNCCPKGTHCGEHNTCCPREAGCEQFLVEDPHCANNKTWDLYKTEGNFFCCLSTSSAYLAGGLWYNGSSTTGIACADGIPDGEENEALYPVARGTATQSSSTNTGAIAGGVVGGCAGLALIIALVWFLMRRRRQQAPATDPLMSPDPSTPAQDKKGVYGFELDNNAMRAELQGNPSTMAHELPPDTVRQELPASPVR
ncbi:hypothetical protein ASPSYDRAFT_44011 [Aspergillus sydowii CBS 593.65]|uniref:Epidermal growth factor receptor-like transmembrane-juxtamembrane segment domain-containing protein n=1 Tax=Aspergillus sydowii CBS 593.65 TaxID=1036612 RepID=A0A1L9TJM8_9EURO|nr:uncharacterized protein ASPSYDRAFT_44011 [Aspergillus sydowii CBS 593.65]OJJ59625.1 hypothetical protein ASPSYDRAFT_44011 [Aspergillus sydowii CBS 593.65]